MTGDRDPLPDLTALPPGTPGLEYDAEVLEAVDLVEDADGAPAGITRKQALFEMWVMDAHDYRSNATEGTRRDDDNTT